MVTRSRLIYLKKVDVIVQIIATILLKCNVVLTHLRFVSDLKIINLRGVAHKQTSPQKNGMNTRE